MMNVPKLFGVPMVQESSSLCTGSIRGNEVSIRLYGNGQNKFRGVVEMKGYGAMIECLGEREEHVASAIERKWLDWTGEKHWSGQHEFEFRKTQLNAERMTAAHELKLVDRKIDSLNNMGVTYGFVRPVSKPAPKAPAKKTRK